MDASLRKFPCATCGADLVWNPGSSALKCPYCGAERKLPVTAEAIREHPVEDALRSPRDLGWGTERKTVRCTRCGATTTLPPGMAAGACAFCGTPAVVEAPPNANMVRPEGLLPFSVDRGTAAGTFRGWLSSLWFRPNDLKSRSSLSGLQGVYIPFWTFDAATHSAWTAEAGTRYRVGGSDRTEIRWQSASGTLEHFFDDLPVPASRGLDPSMTEGIEPFPTAGLVPYVPDYLSGFLAEEYAVDLSEALAAGKERMQAELRDLCGGQVPGDVHRNLDVRTVFSGLAYKNALLPVWIAAYQYNGKPFRFLVNGVTGRVSGEAPWSIVKIALALLALLTLYVLLQR